MRTTLYNKRILVSRTIRQQNRTVRWQATKCNARERISKHKAFNQVRGTLAAGTMRKLMITLQQIYKLSTKDEENAWAEERFVALNSSTVVNNKSYKSKRITSSGKYVLLHYRLSVRYLLGITFNHCGHVIKRIGRVIWFPDVNNQHHEWSLKNKLRDVMKTIGIPGDKDLTLSDLVEIRSH